MASDNPSAVAPAIEEFIIPGTAADVVKHYRALATGVVAGTEALFEDEYIVFDTETTGFNPIKCSLIEIAASRICGDEVLDRFQTFVDPGRRIPEEIVELTGITDADVSGAPSPAEAVAAFAQFAGNTALVAHNASFDLDFVMRQAEPGMLRGPAYDSLALSQIVFPRFASHRLADLSRAFGLSSPTHRADADVVALEGLWRILLRGVRSMPVDLVSTIARLSPDTDWPLRTLFEQVAAAAPGSEFSLRQARFERSRASAGLVKNDAEELVLAFPSDDELRGAFSTGGVADAMYPGYETREEQVDMALEVVSALRDNGFSVLEAGTGVGKSMAYLLPCSLSARRNGIAIGVATKTNALMDQLVYHELPRLAEALGGLDYIALKGYDHYPCLRKLERMVKNEQEATPRVVHMLAMLLSFVSQTDWGDFDALNLHWGGLPRASVQANANDCLKRRCRFFPNLCYLHGARRRANDADIVVTNHALLFRDVQADNGILPPIRHWVVDEAHAVESEARKQLSLSISARELETLLGRLTGSRSGLVDSVRRSADEVDGGKMLYGACADIEDRIGIISSVATSFFSYVKELGALEAADGYDRLTLWVGPELRESGAWANLLGPGNSLADKLDSLVKRLRDLMSMLEQFENTFAAQRADLSKVASDLEEQACALALVLDGGDDTYVYAAELDRDPERNVERLEAAKLDVGAVLLESFYPNMRSIVFTSATLATGDKKAPFSHFLRTSGLDRIEEERVHVNRLSSSYDFEQNMKVMLPLGMPEPNARDYRDALYELLFEVHCATRGSVLTLFTNRREMESLYHELKPRLAECGIPLIAQLRGTSSKSLRDRFLEDEKLSLFALKSFWEGFDAPGDTLRCVVIPKLPFGKPSEPLARERELRDGRAAWGRYALPEAVMELKQAAGRLIRSSTDSGWLILCDGRLQTKNYANTFLRALPTSNIRVLDLADIVDELSS